MLTRYFRLPRPQGPCFAALAPNADELELLDAAPWLGGKPSGERQLFEQQATLLAPVTPSKVVCVAKNYRAHAAEMQGEVPTAPVLFFKPPSSVCGPGAAVLLPPESSRVDFEAELGVVIGKRGRRIPVERARDHVFGYTVLCDVTARDLQKAEPLWTRGKGFDTFCPVGPSVVSGLELAAGLDIRLWQNGELRQDSNTAQMVFDVATIISAASQFLTLEPGDLLATGTPEGVGPMAHGDQIRIEIAQLGALEFPVQRELLDPG